MSLIFSQSLSYYAIHLKVILISTTVISAAVALKVSAPAIADFAVTDAPSIYNGFVSWLKPPYLYLVINCIIIIIVASSKFQSKVVDYESSPTSISPLLERIPVPVHITVPVHLQNEILSPIKHFDYVDYLVHEEAVEAVRSEDIQLDDDSLNSDVKYYEPVVWVDDEKVVEELIESPTVDAPTAEIEITDQVSLSKSSWSPSPLIRKDSSDFLESNEKPLVSARFGHRRSVRGSPEGGKTSLRVSKSRKQETIENTWKTITEGRAMPLARHLRKSDTWETRGGRHQIPIPPQDAKMKKTETFHDKIPIPPQDAKMTKTETFHDRGVTTTTNSSSSNSLQSLSPGSGGKLKREASLSQDDLNKRVEAFIKKFNEEMRMQRQESLNQYSEMITRGAHY